MTRSKLPARPSLDSLRKQAKKLARDIVAGDADAIARARAQLPQAELPLSQRDAQLVLAREYGFPGWQDLLKEVQQRLGRGLEWPYPKLAASFMTMTSRACDNCWPNIRRYCRGRQIKTTAGCSEWPQVPSATVATRSPRSTSRASNVPSFCSMPVQSSRRRCARASST